MNSDVKLVIPIKQKKKKSKLIQIIHEYRLIVFN